MIAELVRNLRLGVRTLGKSPGLSAAAVLSLALGIGANTTVFTFVSAILLPPLRVQDLPRLISLYTREGSTPFYLPTSFPNFEDYRRLNRVFVDMGALWKVPLMLGKGAAAERVLGEIVTGNYFSLLGVQPVQGRAFLPEEDRTPGSHPVAVISHGLWTRRFGGDPGLVGSDLTLDGHAFTVVGVAPEGFRGTAIGASVEIWVPMMMHREVLSTYSEWVGQRRAIVFEVIGRLKPDTGLKEAETAMAALAAQLEQEYPDDNKGRSVTLVPLRQARIHPSAQGAITLTSGFLLVVVAVVLLIACVNLANLQLARASGRGREMSVRAALGAGRARLVRQLLTESLLLAVAGGALGLVVAVAATRFLWSLLPPTEIPLFLDLRPDGGVLLFTAAVAILAGLAFGLAPALRASRPDVVSALKESAATGTGMRRIRLTKLLLVSQVCGSLVLLISAALFVRSLREARHIDPGLAVDDVSAVSIEPGLYGYDQPRGRLLYAQASERVRGLAGVQSAAFASSLPLAADTYRIVVPEGKDPTQSDSRAYVMATVVSSGYFETVGLPLLHGRDFDGRDREGSVPVAIVNETMVKRYWPNQSPLGKRIHLWDQAADCEVVGIAKDSKYTSLGEEPQPFMYLPLEQNFRPTMNLLVRSSAAPPAVAGALRAEMRLLDDNVPVLGVRTLREHLAGSLWLPRTGAAVLGFFGVLALLLTAVGLYGVAANAVSQRTREIGLRLALGGEPRHVLRLLLRESMRLVLVGVVLGLATAAAVTRFLSGLLYGVAATDLLTFIGAAAALALVAVVATFLPARTATRVDPMVALRYE